MGEGFFTGGKQFDAVLGAGDASRLDQFSGRDGSSGIDARGVDPGDQLGEVERLDVKGESVGRWGEVWVSFQVIFKLLGGFAWDVWGQWSRSQLDPMM